MKSKLVDSTTPSYTSPNDNPNNAVSIKANKHRKPTHESIASDREAPRDHMNLVYLVSLILGIGTLLGYNVLVTSSDYFLAEYPHHKQIVFWMVPAYSAPNFLFVFVVIAYGHLFSFTTRLLVVFLSTAAAIVVVPIISGNLDETVSYYGILIICGLVGCSTATLQATTLSFTGLLPIKYTLANVSGQSLAGIVACIIRIFTKLFEPDNDRGYIEGGLIYFIIGALVDVICAVSFLMVLKTIFVKYHLRGYFKRRKMIKAKKKGDREYVAIAPKQKVSLYDADEEDNIGEDERGDGGILIREDTQRILATVAQLEDDSNDVLAIERERSVSGQATTPRNTQNNTQTTQNSRQIMLRTGSNANNTSDTNNAAVATVVPVSKMSNKKDEALMAQLYGRDASNSILNNNSNDFSRSITQSMAGAIDISPANHSCVPSFQNDGNANSLRSSELMNNNGNNNDPNGTKTIIFNSTHARYHLTTETLKKRRTMSTSEHTADYKIVFNKIKFAWFACFLAFLVTFLIFPGLVTSVESEISSIENNGWMPVILITEFNLGDYFGRQFVASWTKMGFNNKTLWIGSVWRVLIYPIWLMLYYNEIKSDLVAHIAMIILSVTNGHICCLAFMYPPTLVEDYEMDTSSALMSFAAVAGIVVGSYTALGITYIWPQ